MAALVVCPSCKFWATMVSHRISWTSLLTVHIVRQCSHYTRSITFSCIFCKGDCDWSVPFPYFDTISVFGLIWETARTKRKETKEEASRDVKNRDSVFHSPSLSRHRWLIGKRSARGKKYPIWLRPRQRRSDSSRFSPLNWPGSNSRRRLKCNM